MTHRENAREPTYDRHSGRWSEPVAYSIDYENYSRDQPERSAGRYHHEFGASYGFLSCNDVVHHMRRVEQKSMGTVVHLVEPIQGENP